MRSVLNVTKALLLAKVKAGINPAMAVVPSLMIQPANQQHVCRRYMQT